MLSGGFSGIMCGLTSIPRTYIRQQISRGSSLLSLLCLTNQRLSRMDLTLARSNVVAYAAETEAAARYKPTSTIWKPRRKPHRESYVLDGL